MSTRDIKRAQTSVILTGKKVMPSSFSTKFCKKVVLSKQVKNTVAV